MASPEASSTRLMLGLFPVVGFLAYRLWRARVFRLRAALPLEPPPRVQVRIIYASVKGSCRAIAQLTAAEARRLGLDVGVCEMAQYDAEWLTSEAVVLLIIPTYTHGRPPPSAAAFYDGVIDAASDFRVEAGEFARFAFAVFGAGSSVYASHFNTAAKRLDGALGKLGAQRLLPRTDGDSAIGELASQSAEWTRLVCQRLLERQAGGGALPPSASNGKSGAAADFDSDSDGGEGDDQPLMDLEDLAGPSKRGENGAASDGAPKQMVTPSLRKSLTKQGYKIVGSHSGVKLCRWTKSMLRGRGGCYKHSMYGIASHRCMEMTPSLACANKCVFCWRHHDNPVGTSFTWEVDEAAQLLREALAAHRSMINEARGIQGALAERVAEGMEPRHCALSLVGEPIMYPRINQFVHELHLRRISSFLVTNAQFPDALRALRPVTQLYLSIDAPTKEQLQAVDRPIFEDFWERFLECIRILAEKPERTVFRLTLVNGWNLDQIGAYAELVALGRPDFVEIKGVTYCGKSDASPLTIKNCPFHEEVRKYSADLCARICAAGGSYGVASEHAHSNSVLLARSDFCVRGVWHTWIDYERFADLALAGGPVVATDYMAPTPAWAQFNEHAIDGGFDPGETRHASRTGKLTKTTGGC